MTVTEEDLRFNISMLFDMLNKGEDIFITYRGEVKAKLISYTEPSNEEKTDSIFGMWKNRN
jgi:antitoxin (DNA-binding transcriptional repressor) of toxin-antitoxin stability system